MVNEPKIDVNNEFFTGDLQLLYYKMTRQVFEHREKLYMACCMAVETIRYILYGCYIRKVVDAVITGYHNGIPDFKIVSIDKFHVQRLMHTGCRHQEQGGQRARGHTHALMFEWFIPYQKYSVRFVLLHLELYFRTGETIEKFCLDHEIPISTFRRWLQWMEENMSHLREMGLVKDRKENRGNLNKWLSEIMENVSFWLLKSLSRLNRVLFQRHEMPADYKNYIIGSLIEIPVPT
mgnify:CR=1 FL=1